MNFTADELRELFVLLDDGTLIRKTTNSIAGAPNTTRRGKQYWRIRIGMRRYTRSHLVFCMTRGYWPEPQIDHIDGNSLNDSPFNLRESTQQQNCWNRHTRAKRLPLPIGVRPLPSGRFQARIMVNDQPIALGSFESISAARQAYLAARLRCFGEFA